MKKLITELLQYDATVYAIEDTALRYINQSNIDYNISNTFLCYGIEYHKILALLDTYNYEKLNDYTIIVSVEDGVQCTIKVPTMVINGNEYFYDSKYNSELYFSNVSLNLHYIAFKLLMSNNDIVVSTNDSEFPIPTQIDIVDDSVKLSVNDMLQLMVNFQLTCTDKTLSKLDTKRLTKSEILELYSILLRVVDLSNHEIKAQIIQLLSMHNVIDSDYIDSAIEIVPHITDCRDFLYLICYVFVGDDDYENSTSSHLFELSKSDPRFSNRMLALAHLDINDKASIIDAIKIDNEIQNSQLLSVLLGKEFQQDLLNKKIPLSLDDLNITYEQIIKLDIDISDVPKYIDNALKLIVNDKLENTNEKLTSYFQQFPTKRHTKRHNRNKGTTFEFDNDINHRNRNGRKYREFDSRYRQSNYNFDNYDYDDYEMIN